MMLEVTGLQTCKGQELDISSILSPRYHHLLKCSRMNVKYYEEPLAVAKALIAISFVKRKTTKRKLKVKLKCSRMNVKYYEEPLAVAKALIDISFVIESQKKSSEWY